MTELPIVGEQPELLWAEEVEEDSRLPERHETFKDGIKIITDYHKDNDAKLVKTVYKYKVETKRLAGSVARRKKLSKFGSSKNDATGPNTSNTSIGDTVTMQFIRSRGGELLELTKNQDDTLSKLISHGGSMIRCRYCKGPDHMTAQCPYKDLIESTTEQLDGGATANDVDQRAKDAEEKMKHGTYVPPSLRSNAAAASSRSSMDMRRDDMTVRVTNLPDDMSEDDLKEIFNKAGKVQRIFLARDKVTQRCKGFAFVTYHTREDAEKAIITISNHRYDHLILKVEWAKQP